MYTCRYVAVPASVLCFKGLGLEKGFPHFFILPSLMVWRVCAIIFFHVDEYQWLFAGFLDICATSATSGEKERNQRGRGRRETTDIWLSFIIKIAPSHVPVFQRTS